MVITQRDCGSLGSGLYTVVSDSSYRSGKEPGRRDHLVLVWIKGEQHSYVGAPARITGECRLSKTSKKT